MSFQENYEVIVEQLTTLKEKLNEKESQLKNSTIEKDQFCANLEHKLEVAEQNLRNTEEKLKRLTDAYEAMVLQKESLKKELEASELNLAQARSRIEDLLQSKNESVQTLTRKMQEALLARDNLESVTISLKAKLEDLRKDSDRERAHLLARQKELEELLNNKEKEHHKEMEKMISELNNTHASLKQQAAQLNMELETVKQEWAKERWSILSEKENIQQALKESEVATS